jgi:hypothetical protein
MLTLSGAIAETFTALQFEGKLFQRLFGSSPVEQSTSRIDGIASELHDVKLFQQREAVCWVSDQKNYNFMEHSKKGRKMKISTYAHSYQERSAARA